MRVFLFSLFLLFTLALSIHAQGQQGVIAKNETAWGLNTTTFETPYGKVKVNLTDDITPGDTFSGTVIAEPKSEEDAGVLNGMVIEVDESKHEVADMKFKSSIPLGLTEGEISILLLDKDGNEISKGNAPIKEEIPEGERPATPSPDDYDIPRIGQAGRPLIVKGPFNGDFENTSLNADGKVFDILAESPRKAVFSSPSDMIGHTELSFREGDIQKSGDFNNLSVDLSATKTKLVRGETARVMVDVSGLEGLDLNRYPVYLALKNLTPEVISFREADSVMTHSIDPAHVEGVKGSYSFSTEIRARNTGTFHIIAIVSQSPEIWLY
jgi:hypothetical protein